MNPYLSFDFKSKYQSFLQACICFFIILACFSLHLPIAWLSISSGLVVVLWILKFDYFSSFKVLKRNPAALVALALLGLYLLGLIFTKASWDLGLKFFLKYTKLLLIPIIISISPSERIRSLGLKAFLFSSLIILFISYAQFFNLLPDLNQFLPKNTYKSNETEGYIVFKGYIAHNILMAFAMFMMLCRFAFTKKLTYKIVWLFLAAITFLNIIYLVHSRTGQIISILLIVFFVIYHYRIKSLLWLLMIAISIFVFRNELLPLVPNKILETKHEIVSHDASRDVTSTSAGRRYEIYSNTINLIKNSYGMGYGTGSFKEEYAKFVANQHTFLSNPSNPHNQFLLTALELGIFGLSFLLLMFYIHWHLSRFLKNKEHDYLVKSLVILIVVGSLFNSLFLDATEGKFYCLLIGLLLSGYTGQNALFVKSKSSQLKSKKRDS
jgi:O-antigen ligase